ncbi:MAG TPA: hypothetical protein VI699_03420 [Candidatus Acidoferrales bacterium]|nr:hypothetical protein [Candidatus Acidoferrales bacterium]
MPALALAVYFGAEVVVGALLGFLSGLAVEAIWGHIAEKKEAREVLSGLRAELLDNRRIVASRLNTHNEVHLGGYESSQWLSAVRTGAVRSLRGLAEGRAHARAYQKLEELSWWERMQAELYFHVILPTPSTALLESEYAKVADFVQSRRRELLDMLDGFDLEE